MNNVLVLLFAVIISTVFVATKKVKSINHAESSYKTEDVFVNNIIDSSVIITDNYMLSYLDSHVLKVKLSILKTKEYRQVLKDNKGFSHNLETKINKLLKSEADTIKPLNIWSLQMLY